MVPTLAQAREIARLVVALERETGHVVDVECAFAGGELHLLQCRPVTTLGDDFPFVWPEPGDDKLTWQREDLHFGDVLPPLSMDYVTLGPKLGAQRASEQLADFPIAVVPSIDLTVNRRMTLALLSCSRVITFNATRTL